MDPITGVIASLVAPAALCAICLSVGLLISRLADGATDSREVSGRARGGSWAAALGLGLSALVAGAMGGGIVARLGASGLAALRPGGVNDWILLFVALATILGVAQSALNAPHRWHARSARLVFFGARVVFSTAMIFSVLRLLAGGRLSGASGAVWAVVLGSATALVWHALDAAADAEDRREPRLGALVVAGIAATMSGPVLAIWGAVTSAQIAIALAAGLGVIITFRTLRVRVANLAQGGVTVFALSFGVIWTAAAFWTETPLASVALLWGAPLAAWVGAVPRVRKLKTWQITLVQAALALALSGAAVGIAVARAPNLDFAF